MSSKQPHSSGASPGALRAKYTSRRIPALHEHMLNPTIAAILNSPDWARVSPHIPPSGMQFPSKQLALDILLAHGIQVLASSSDEKFHELWPALLIRPLTERAAKGELGPKLMKAARTKPLDRECNIRYSSWIPDVDAHVNGIRTRILDAPDLDEKMRDAWIKRRYSNQATKTVAFGIIIAAGFQYLDSNSLFAPLAELSPSFTELNLLTTKEI